MTKQSDTDAAQMIMLRRSNNLGRWIILLQIAVLVTLFFKFRLSVQIERDVLRAIDKAESNEKTTIDFMARTVERWEKLRENNPKLAMPEVKEPRPLPKPD